MLRAPVAPGLAVAFGLVPVVRLALRLDVPIARRAAAAERLDVVPLESVAAVAACFGADRAVEGGEGSELERGAELGGDVAAEVLHGVNVDAVVDDRFQERVLGEVARDPHGD